MCVLTNEYLATQGYSQAEPKLYKLQAFTCITVDRKYISDRNGSAVIPLPIENWLYASGVQASLMVGRRQYRTSLYTVDMCQCAKAFDKIVQWKSADDVIFAFCLCSSFSQHCNKFLLWNVTFIRLNINIQCKLSWRENGWRRRRSGRSESGGMWRRERIKPSTKTASRQVLFVRYV